jgi:hypothetical protein
MRRITAILAIMITIPTMIFSQERVEGEKAWHIIENGQILGTGDEKYQKNRCDS